MFSKKIATMILGLSAALLTGCEAEQTEKDMLAEAQFCLDDATTASAANACMSKISGLSSPQAYSLRCAAGFVASGITTPANLSNALTAISEGGGPTEMLSALNFGDVALVNQTASDCNASGKEGLALIGAMAKSATALSNAAEILNLGSCGGDLSGCDTAAIEDAISDILSNPSAPAAEAAIEAIGSSIQTVYSSTCGGTNNANTDICGDINQALAAANITDITNTPISQIGAALLEQWRPPAP